ncbi:MULTISPECIES: DUF6767 domain-containing protein [Corynebacterium]|uniref:Uncharacterized protein n=1 Tax=Corynebacterium glucuronolyticum TaxID=39791 RepID=A0A7T4EI99_9CORY|nr:MULTISPECIES: DUF6767 domain-containing protein [Corynebacterium]MCT1442620.1 hypothetical protein [Corynebacterium glucuronolyticum]MCT1563316.1 hypothetical protein [Corynebacterium glucuronolyticum]QQB47817.1 hypothetical protein I6I10_00930 [Corynebacterium glucuronolyticum]QQU89793.1 hypothetical protein I6I68_11240 [Corynebacterium glucuronolyticum]QRO83883.1 hypothetical protein I6J20_07970 [Corynebacterium glucuronolyticum]
MPVEPKCPIRYGDPCSLCVPGATGPQDCQLVALVRDDPELMELRREMIARKKGENRSRGASNN